ncbi:GNAT family N-acetyltransferase [Mycoplasmatota bacterium]|nr:GNAT family N-acetyltransferase [Mycoplasmatota bacterium]
MIRLAKKEDLNRIDELAVSVINTMKEQNIPQWNLSYPRKEHYEKDIKNGTLFVYEDDIILGVIAIAEQNDLPYEELSNWTDEFSIVIHRILVEPGLRRKGIARKLFNYAIDLSIEKGFTSIKIDTHAENYIMLNLLKKMGFEKVGYLKSIDRVAFELNWGEK